ncbi:hypothetical protein LguiA_021468 [Lonicera macranthoides]
MDLWMNRSPEVEASFYDKDVLIRIHCEKRKGVVEKTVTEVEKLQLLVINSSAMSFGSSALDITIIHETKLSSKAFNTISTKHHKKHKVSHTSRYIIQCINAT